MEQHLENPLIQSCSLFVAGDYQALDMQYHTRNITTFRDHYNSSSISSPPLVPDDVNKKNGNGISDGDSRRSIAERRAATCGFKAEKISCTSATPLPSSPSSTTSSSSSPWITIPPGISPTALLDSPVMLLPDISLPSPTTGTLPMLHNNCENSALNTMTPDVVDVGNNSGSSSSLEPSVDPKSTPGFSSSENQGNDCSFFDLMSMEPSPDFQFVADFSKEFAANRCNDDLVTISIIENGASSNIQTCDSDIAGNNQASTERANIQADEVGTHHLVQEQKGISPVDEGLGRRTENGYNWSNYEQNQIVSTEHPWSHCNSTHPSCQLKKRMESSYDGQITDGLPGSASSFYERTDIEEGIGTYTNLEIDSVWDDIKSGLMDATVGSVGGVDGLERTCSPSVITDLSNSQVKTVGTFQAAETRELSSASVSNLEDDGATHQGALSVAVVANGEESRSKKRRIDSSCFVETSIISRDAREPRVIVQVESEVDIVDDGYRWRKYGQKVVKGNPNPRSYYKCTSAGCSVRKHVERAPHNWKCVVVTYDGKHNHEVPAARNSIHGSMQSQNHEDLITSGFHGNSFLFTNNDYLRPNFTGKLGFDSNAMQQSGSNASLVSGFPVSMQSDLRALASSLSIMGNQLAKSSPFSPGQHFMMPKPDNYDNVSGGTNSLGCVNGSLLSSSSLRQSDLC